MFFRTGTELFLADVLALRRDPYQTEAPCDVVALIRNDANWCSPTETRVRATFDEGEQGIFRAIGRGTPPAPMLAMRSSQRTVRIPGKTRGSATTSPFPLPRLRLYGLGDGSSEPRDRRSPALKLTLGLLVAHDLGCHPTVDARNERGRWRPRHSKILKATVLIWTARARG